jgi:hypothetical protein
MRENEYRQLADSVRRRGREEQNPLFKGSMENFGRRSIEECRSIEEVYDTGTYYDPIPWDRRRDN